MLNNEKRTDSLLIQTVYFRLISDGTLQKSKTSCAKKKKLDFFCPTKGI